MFAQDAFARCPGDTQTEMNICASADYKHADTELTTAYHELAQTPELIATERAWIAYRDAECAYEFGFYQGGSMAPMVYSMCMTRLTNERTAVLKMDATEGH